MKIFGERKCLLVRICLSLVVILPSRAIVCPTILTRKNSIVTYRQAIVSKPLHLNTSIHKRNFSNASLQKNATRTQPIVNGTKMQIGNVIHFVTPTQTVSTDNPRLVHHRPSEAKSNKLDLVGQLIKLRIAKKLSTTQVSGTMGIPKSELERIEEHPERESYDRIYDYAHALGARLVVEIPAAPKAVARAKRGK